MAAVKRTFTDCYTKAEELQLAMEAKQRYDKKMKVDATTAAVASAPVPAVDEKEYLAIFVDTEGRNRMIQQSPQSSIGCVVGSMNPGSFTVKDAFYIPILMPKTATWEDACAAWTLDPKGGGGPDMILRDADKAVDPHTAYALFDGFLAQYQSTHKNCFLVTDAVSYDFGHLSTWREMINGGARYHYKVKSPDPNNNQDFRTPINISQLILSCRKEFGRPGLDANDMKAAGEAATALGFKHDHHPLNDAMKMYATAFIETHFETTKGAGNKREYSIEELKKAGVLPTSVASAVAAAVAKK